MQTPANKRRSGLALPDQKLVVRRADGTEITGKLGGDVSIEEGYEGARLTAINQLAVLKAMLGDG